MVTHQRYRSNSQFCLLSLNAFLLPNLYLLFYKGPILWLITVLNRPDVEEINERNWMPADQCLVLGFFCLFLEQMMTGNPQLLTSLVP